MLTKLDDANNAGTFDICVVGAGPLGIAAALECARSGRSVVLVEGGNSSCRSTSQPPVPGDKVTNAHHSPPELSRARGLGGTSQIWGGRCIPLDNKDFEHGNGRESARWPITHETLQDYYRRAADLLGVAEFPFSLGHHLTEGTQLRSDKVEVWLKNSNVGELCRKELQERENLVVLHGATVSRLHVDPSRRVVSSMEVTNGRIRSTISAQRTILACGGIDTTRLLLLAQADHPSLFGGAEGALGKFYMGHLTGIIADIVLADPTVIDEFDFFPHEDYIVRRRFSLLDEVQDRFGIANIAFWPENPPIYNPDHRNAFLSMLWLMLKSPVLGPRLIEAPYRSKLLGPTPHAIRPHLANIMRSPASAVAHVLRAGWQRYLSRDKRPAYLRRNAVGRYALCYHAEHKPDPRSRITLSDRKDSLGRQALDLSLRFDMEDARSVVTAHRALDKALRESGIGRLEFREEPEALEDAVLAQACDGRHQLGTTRMGADPSRSVVDSYCRVHDLDDTYVASSSVFVTSGSANPTFASLALSLRVADRVLETLSAESSEPAQSHNPVSKQRYGGG